MGNPKRLSLVLACFLGLMVGVGLGAYSTSLEPEVPGFRGRSLAGASVVSAQQSPECGGGEPPAGGWAPWAFDEDGFKTYEMTLAQASAQYLFELPSTSPTGFSLLDEFVTVIYMTGSDYTVHVSWQQPSQQSTGDTITLYAKYGDPYEGHEDDSIWWAASSGTEYELAATDSTVTNADLLAMACSMPSYAGACP